MKKTQILINKPVCLGLSILNLSKTIWILVWLCQTKIWWKCKKLLYGYKYLHCHLKTEHVYKDIPEDIEKRFDTSNFEIDRLLPLANNKTVIGLMKGELSGLIMKRFVGLRAKTYSCLKTIMKKI